MQDIKCLEKCSTRTERVSSRFSVSRSKIRRSNSLCGTSRHRAMENSGRVALQFRIAAERDRKQKEMKAKIAKLAA